jgi:hypothetical protein
MIKNAGLLHYGDYSAGLLKSAEMEKQAWLPILAGIGKLIGWGLTTYGVYKATTENAPQLVDHLSEGEFFSSDKEGGDLGAMGELGDGVLNAWPAAGAAKLGIQGMKRGKGFVQGTKEMFKPGKGWGTSPHSLWGPAFSLKDDIQYGGEGGFVPDSQFNTTDPNAGRHTIPNQEVYDPFYRPSVPQQSGPGRTPPTITAPGGNRSPGSGFGFKLDGNASSNQNRVR